MLPGYKLQTIFQQRNVTQANNFRATLLSHIPQEWLDTLRQDVACTYIAPLVLKTTESVYIIKEITGPRFICQYGIIDPHIQAVYPKSRATISLSIEEIESAIDCLYYASPDCNKIYK